VKKRDHTTPQDLRRFFREDRAWEDMLPLFRLPGQTSWPVLRSAKH
jgi:hypothetical protein